MIASKFADSHCYYLLIFHTLSINFSILANYAVRQCKKVWNLGFKQNNSFSVRSSSFWLRVYVCFRHSLFFVDCYLVLLLKNLSFFTKNTNSMHTQYRIDILKIVKLRIFFNKIKYKIHITHRKQMNEPIIKTIYFSIFDART